MLRLYNDICGLVLLYEIFNRSLDKYLHVVICRSDRLINSLLFRKPFWHVFLGNNLECLGICLQSLLALMIMNSLKIDFYIGADQTSAFAVTLL